MLNWMKNYFFLQPRLHVTPVECWYVTSTRTKTTSNTANGFGWYWWSTSQKCRKSLSGFLLTWPPTKNRNRESAIILPSFCIFLSKAHRLKVQTRLIQFPLWISVHLYTNKSYKNPYAWFTNKSNRLCSSYETFN